MPIDKLSNTTRNYLCICSNHLRAALREHAGISLECLLARQRWFDVDNLHTDNLHTDKKVAAEIADWHQYRNLIDHIDSEGIVPGIGLIIGNKTQLGDLGVLGYASQSSRTFWDGLNVCVPFARQLGWNLQLQHSENVQGKSELRVQRLSLVEVSKAMLEQWLMVCLTGVERLMPVGADIDYSALEFYFPYPQPNDLRLYREMFRGATLCFDADFCGWRYPRAWNRIELPTRDDSVSSFCMRELVLQQSPRVSKMSIDARVKNYLYAQMGSGLPSMVMTAQYLNMSVATLRRKLKDCNTTFEMLVEDMRKELALSLIGRPHVTGEELACQLGYRHSSNFYAAFKQWFGCSPKEYRKWHMQNIAV